MPVVRNAVMWLESAERTQGFSHSHKWRKVRILSQCIRKDRIAQFDYTVLLFAKYASIRLKGEEDENETMKARKLLCPQTPAFRRCPPGVTVETRKTCYARRSGHRAALSTPPARSSKVTGPRAVSPGTPKGEMYEDLSWKPVVAAAMLGPGKQSTPHPLHGELPLGPPWGLGAIWGQGHLSASRVMQSHWPSCRKPPESR